MSLDALLPPGLEAGVAAALVAASFGSSFLTAAFGIGGGVLMLAVLASLLPPAALIPVHGVVQIGSNLGRAAIMIAHVDWRVVPGFLSGSVLGAALGGSVAVNLPTSAVLIGVGLFIVWSVFASPPPIFRRFAALTGGISSVLTMFFGATGPFVASYVKALGLGREAHVATHATLMSLQHVLKTVVFGVLGFAFGPWLAFVAAMIAAGLLGTVAGRQILARTTDARFYKVLNALLLLLAARLIWQGGTEALGG